MVPERVDFKLIHLKVVFSSRNTFTTSSINKSFTGIERGFLRCPSVRKVTDSGEDPTWDTLHLVSCEVILRRLRGRPNCR